MPETDTSAKSLHVWMIPCKNCLVGPLELPVEYMANCTFHAPAITGTGELERCIVERQGSFC